MYQNIREFDDNWKFSCSAGKTCFNPSVVGKGIAAFGRVMG
jgi:hypothetical protein